MFNIIAIRLPVTSLKESFEDKNKRLFSKWALVYDGFWFRLYLEPLYQHIVRIIEERKTDVLRSGGSTLDIASGTGEILKRFAEKFPQATFKGIDMTAAMVEKAKDKTVKLSNVSIDTGNASTLPFPNDSFDVVLILDALHHMLRPERVLSEVRRVLKTGGLFLLVDPAKETPLMVLFGWLFKSIEKAYTYYSQPMLQVLLKREGFIVLETTRLSLNNFVFSTVSRKV